METEVKLTDDIESSHSELTRSRDYSNEELYPDDRLRLLAEKWLEQAQNPIRSERSRRVCGSIALRSTFELAGRNDRMDTMIAFYKGEVDE